MQTTQEPRSNEFKYISPGLPAEMAALTIDDLCHHYATHLHDFVLDGNLGSAYLNRFLAEPDLQAHQDATKCLIHLMQKMVQLLPFNPGVRNLFGQIFNSPEDKAKATVLEKQTLDEALTLGIQQLHAEGKQEEAYTLLCQKLQENPGHVGYAEMLLELTLTFDFELGQWFDAFETHPLLKHDWQAYAAFQAAKQGKHELAVNLWESLQSSDFTSGDNTLNHIGMSYSNLGEKNKAREIFMRSLALDPSQHAIKHLINEIDSPFKVDDDILDGRNVPILIYTYNKARLLEITLRDVCESDIGNCDVIVLINGCTDHSLEVARQAQAKYTNRTIEIIDMPINMGAPAARNYLLDHVKKTRDFKYVAYLDDDVTLPKNWLTSLVTAMEEDAKIGAVGCQVLTPDGLLQQYLYRDVTIAKPGVFRLGWATPFSCRSIGMYNVRRDVDTIMGCCHLIRKECFDTVPGFDIQFSPSQLDDVAFHLDLGLNGWKVRYLGQLECTHYRATGFEGRNNTINGNAMGNDVKFYYRFLDHLDTFKQRLHANTAEFMNEIR